MSFYACFWRFKGRMDASVQLIQSLRRRWERGANEEHKGYLMESYGINNAAEKTTIQN